MAQQQATAMITVLPSNTEIKKYSHGSALKLAICQIVCGIMAIIFAVIDIIGESDVSVIGTGIWCGVIFIVAGILGIVSSKSKVSRCHIISFMVLSIISATFAFILLPISIMGIIINMLMTRSYYRVGFPFGLTPCIMLIIISLVEATISIISSAMCCRATCNCCSPQPSQGMVYFYPTPNQNINSLPTGQQLELVSVPAGTVYSMPNGVIIDQGMSINQQSFLANSVTQVDDIQSLNSTPPSFYQVTAENNKNNEKKQYQYSLLE